MPVDRVQVAKSDQTLSTIATYGTMNPEQLKAYYQLAQNEPTLLQDLEIQYMKSPTALIESLEFTGRITRKATEKIAFTTDERGVLTASGKELNAVKVRCEVLVSDEFSEDNLMGQSVDNYIRSKMAARHALDFQDMIVLGDTSSTDPTLSAFNGILKQIDTIGTGVTDLASEDKSVNDDVLWFMWLQLATKYRTDKQNLRFYCNDDVISTYKQWFGKRETSRADTIMENGIEVTRFNGVRFYDVTSMPAGTILLTNRKNIRPGVWQNVRPYAWPFPPAGYTLYGLHLRADVKIIEDDCAIMVTGLNTSGMTTA